MTADPDPDPSGITESEGSLAPTGKLGFRGRRAAPEERGQILDAYFFEGDRRIPETTSLPGVGIAVALVPPLATVGLTAGLVAAGS